MGTNCNYNGESSVIKKIIIYDVKDMLKTNKMYRKNKNN